MIPAIRHTDFPLLQSTNRLCEYFQECSSLSLTKQCHMPLGRYKKMQLQLIPQSYMIELADKWKQWNEISKIDGNGNLGPMTYFVIGKCKLADGLGRMNPGVRGALSGIHPT